MNPVQLFYNNPYFENLKETKPFLNYLEKEEQKIKETIQGGKVLDMGVGTGRSTKILSNLSDDVTGIDFSERLFEKAKENLKNYKNVKLYFEDAKSTHFEDGSFDYILMSWNFFGNLYNSREKVLKESKRILKPNGKILGSVFSEKVIDSYLEMLKINGLQAEHIDENYIFLNEGLVSERFSKSKLERIFSKGMNYNIEPLTKIAYWFEVTKPPQTF